MSINKTEALVLGTVNLTGAHKIITLYSPDYGQIRGVAHGVKRIKNPFGSALEPLTHINLIFKTYPNRELQIIQSSDIINAFTELRTDLLSLTAALYMAELIQKLTPLEGAGQPEIFCLMLKTLSLIPNAVDLKSIIHIFEIRLLDLLGYKPHLEKCLCCSETHYCQGWGFSPSMGGVLCIKCKSRCNDLQQISPGGIMFLKKALELNIDIIGRLRLTRSSSAEVEKALQAAISQHLASALKSYPVLIKIFGGE